MNSIDEIDEILMEHYPPGGRGKKSGTKAANVADKVFDRSEQPHVANIAGWTFGKSLKAEEFIEVPVAVDAETRAYLKREFEGVAEIPVETDGATLAHFERIYGGPIDGIVISRGG